MKRSLLLFVLVLSFTLIFCGEKNAQNNKKEPDELKKVEFNKKEPGENQTEDVKEEQIASNTPSFKYNGLKLLDMDGKEVVFEDAVAGKVIILDFWDTWCPPCKMEIPGFIELYDQYKEKGLLIIGVAFGRNGFDEVKKFTAENKINYPIYVPADKAQAQKYLSDIKGIPTTHIIDTKTMEIKNTHVGFVEKIAFENDIKPYLE